MKGPFCEDHNKQNKHHGNKATLGYSNDFFLNTSFRNIRGKGSGRLALNQKFQNFLRLEVERVVNGAKILLENIITPKIIKISKLKKYREEVQTEQKCPVSTLILVKFVHSLRG